MSLAAPAEASLRLRIEDQVTGNGVVVTGVGGLVNYSGSLGAGSPFTVNVTTGIGAPIMPGAGSPYLAEIHLNSVNVATSGAGSLRIILEQDGNVGPVGTLFAVGSVSSTIVATAGSTIQVQSFVNSANVVPGLGPDSGPPAGPLGAVTDNPPGTGTNTYVYPPAGLPAGYSAGNGSFGLDPAPVGFANAGVFSMVTETVLTFTGNGTASFDADLAVSAVPEPATMASAMAGVVLFGAGFWLRRRRSSV
jgi:hypothetical protein